MQAVRGEGVSVRVLQVVFAYGVAVLLHDFVSGVETYFLVGLLFAVVVLYSFSRGRLESAFNGVVRRSVGGGVSTGEIVGFMTSVLFEGRDVLDDMLKVLGEGGGRGRRLLGYLRVVVYLTAPAALLFVSVVLMFLVLNSVSPREFLVGGVNVGCTLLFLVYALVVIFRVRPASYTRSEGEHTPSGEGLNLQPLITSLIEKYTYENVVRGKSVPASLLSVLALLFPLPKLEIKAPSFWLGTYLCSDKLANLVEEMKNKKKEKEEKEREEGTSVEGSDVTEFFECDKLGGVEKWVELQEISPEEMLSKVMGEESGKGSREGQVLKITVKYEGENVAYIVMRVWKGCKVRKRIRRYRRYKRRYRLVIDEVQGWRLVSVFIIGVPEYVEALKLRIELAARRATTENVTCEES